MSLLHGIGHWLARRLSEPRPTSHVTTSHPQHLRATLRRGDVLLVEGTSRFATAIRYITQSTWSHSALCISDVRDAADGRPMLIEADVTSGVRLVPLELYARHHTRICRPVGLHADEIDALVDYVQARIGQQYDVRNVLDLGRYLLSAPPVPDRYRRRLLALGSGEPTRAICSSLIADAFEAIHYPILPEVEVTRCDGPSDSAPVREILHIRNSRLFAPRDFDVSPYFRIVKPALESGFDPHALIWGRVREELVQAGHERT
ncbi:YiiX/YebB-like N1pC/P60 family cysteine hydrolase [Dokdonella sp.]|uniref:YiiX/YebB-like N1pC/P60 family cysteine hydrolase n=1 Tax=Dokdonella sp. TaxID=2291710 RepID=UPI0031C05B9F|nr:lipo-like protein [Dokdonella sp.]